MEKSYKMYRPFRCEFAYVFLTFKKRQLSVATATSFDCAPVITIVFCII